MFLLFFLHTRIRKFVIIQTQNKQQVVSVAVVEAPSSSWARTRLVFMIKI